jgi:peroxiredoxin
MKKTTCLLLSLALLAACQKHSDTTTYTINGIAKNIPDSTQLFLYAKQKIIDSTMVLREKFQFKGAVEKPTKVYLRVKNSQDYKSFWLENNTISFIAKKGEFNAAKVTGSKTQKEANLLEERMKPIQQAKDSLIKILADRTLSRTRQDSIRTAFDKLGEKESETSKKFIRDYPNSLISSNLLNTYKSFWGKETCKKLFAHMNIKSQQSENGKSIARFLRLNKNPKVGEKNVDFEQKNVNGDKIKLSQIKATYILLEFWASWCAPCRSANPNLVKEYEMYRDKGFEIIGISLDQDRNSWIKAIEKDKLPWKNVSDLKGTENEVSLIYGVNQIPDNFLIDKNGIIIGRALRGNDLSKKLQELFDKEP